MAFSLATRNLVPNGNHFALFPLNFAFTNSLSSLAIPPGKHLERNLRVALRLLD